jgi:ABC-type sugar transport system permease subunit
MSRPAGKKQRLRENLTGYAFLAPFGIPFLLFFLIPIFHGLYISFTNLNLITNTDAFVGIENYRKLIVDEVYRTSLLNTFIFVIENVPVVIICGLIFALMLNQPFPGRLFARATFIAPYLITGSAIAIIWQFVLSSEGGILNHYLELLGLPEQSWLNTPGQAMWAVVLVTLWWRIGFTLLVLLAGLQDVPSELYDAAMIDGAGNWQAFRYLTLPLLMPVLAFVTIIRFIASFKVFAQVYLVTAGGPFGSTRVLIQYLYEHGFQYYNTAYAAAIGWSLFLIILLVTLVQLRYFRQYESYY